MCKMNVNLIHLFFVKNTQRKGLFIMSKKLVAFFSASGTTKKVAEMVNSFPLFYLPNTKAEMNSFESFEEELCKVSKFKGKYHKYAIKVLENLLEAEEIVVHHPPF